jgi:BASS family bile acid:Na+ symporter
VPEPAATSTRRARLAGAVSTWAAGLVVVAAVVGWASRGAIAGATGSAVPIALAILVLVVAASTVMPARASMRGTGRLALLAVVAPAVALPAIAWAASHLVDGPAADGVLALGLAPAEIASVATVSIAGGDAVLAAATLAGSVVVTTVVGPLVLRLAASSADVDVATLIGGLVLEVIVPFAVGLAIGSAVRRVVSTDELDGLAVLIVSVLAALTASQLPEAGALPRLAAAAAAVVVGGYAVGGLTGRLAPRPERSTFWLTSGMRDFAVAAALATAAFGPAAAAAAAPFGVLVLVSGTALATAVRRSRRPGDG